MKTALSQSEIAAMASIAHPALAAARVTWKGQPTTEGHIALTLTDILNELADGPDSLETVSSGGLVVRRTKSDRPQVLVDLTLLLPEPPQHH